MLIKLKYSSRTYTQHDGVIPFVSRSLVKIAFCDVIDALAAQTGDILAHVCFELVQVGVTMNLDNHQNLIAINNVTLVKFTFVITNLLVFIFNIFMVFLSKDL